jgi:hypothetical protein
VAREAPSPRVAPTMRMLVLMMAGYVVFLILECLEDELSWTEYSNGCYQRISS